MNDAKQNLATAVREAQTNLELSQEKLAEILNIDSRTILNIEAGHGNPKFEKLYPLVTYLKIPTDKIFYPNTATPQPSFKQLMTELNGCTEQEVEDLIPMIRYLLNLMRRRNNPNF